MHKIVFIALFFSANVFATHIEEAVEKKPEPSKQRMHDTLVGYCAAYHLMLGQHESGAAVQKLAKNRMHMAASGNALARHYQKSPEDKRFALMLGQNACNILKFPSKEPQRVIDYP